MLVLLAVPTLVSAWFAGQFFAIFAIRQYFKTKGWYAEDREKFAKTDVVKAGEWLAIRKEALPNSFSKNWDEQQNLITEAEYIPNAPEVSYATTAYFKVHGIYLLCHNCPRPDTRSHPLWYNF